MMGFSAYYDLEKNRIVNANRGTLAYAHELGHKFLHEKLGFLNVFYLVYVDYIIIMVLTDLAFNLSDGWISKIFMGALFFLILGEEVFAWGFGLANHWKRKKK